MVLLIGVIVLWASTIGMILLDKSYRAGRAQPSSDAPSFAEEPAWGTLIALCVVLNLAALPYYFYSTRRSALGGLFGVGAFGVCFVLMIMAQTVARIAGL